jgi:hypothetical protein
MAFVLGQIDPQDAGIMLLQNVGTVHPEKQGHIPGNLNLL